MSTAIPPISKTFPTSTASPSRIFRFPGVSPSGTEHVRKVLTENDHKYDIFEKIRYQHNHFPHSILTRYALGASPQLLHDNWVHDQADLISLDPDDAERQQSKTPPDPRKIPDEINRDNWDDPRWLEYDGAYAKYLAFFHAEIDRLGPIETIRTYVFSPAANWEGKKAMMLARLHGGFLHPMIHVGFGLEFQDRLLVAEGLAEACVHKVDLFGDMFDPPFPKDIYDSLSSRTTAPAPIASSHLSSWSPLAADSGARTPRKGMSLLEIYAELCTKSETAPVKYDPDMLMRDRFINATAEGRGDLMKSLVSQWTLDPEDLEGDGLERKLEEVYVLVTLLACATGRKGRENRVDFFLMHALTSSIFLPSYMPYLNPSERKAMLHTYLLTCLSTAISRGRPAIDPELIMGHTAYPTGPGTLPSTDGGKEVLSPANKEETQNAWLGVIQSSLFAHDSHVPKAIRSLVHHSSLYGHVAPGGVIGAYKNGASKPTLPGSEKLDGTMFIRAAGLIMDTLGWCREGQKEGHWDMSALGYNDAWKE